MKRTDAHRPGMIDPSAYTYLLTYSLGWRGHTYDVPSNEWTWGLEALAAACAMRIPGAGVFGTSGKCGVCGALFSHGDLWQHTSGELVHVGHECADKYQMIANRADFMRALADMKELRASEIEREKRRIARAKFLEGKDQLAVYLDLGCEKGHTILTDMSAKLSKWGSLSDKQVAFAMRLGAELSEPAKPAPRAQEAHAAAPEGRQTFTGTVIKIEERDSTYGATRKVTIKVESEDGTWLAWGTLPSAIYSTQRGDTVTLTATFQRGRDAHFALFSRPTNAENPTLTARREEHAARREGHARAMAAQADDLETAEEYARAMAAQADDLETSTSRNYNPEALP